MHPLQNIDSTFERVIAQIPVDARQSLTLEQITALRLAFRQFSWSKHAIDLRFSIPFPKRGFYIVFVAGRERRSAKRLQAQNPRYRQQGFAALFGFILLCGAVATIGFATLQFFLTAADRTDVHPTAIPWLQTQSSCIQTGRTWRDGECYDAEHSPDF